VKHASVAMIKRKQLGQQEKVKLQTSLVSAIIAGRHPCLSLKPANELNMPQNCHIENLDLILRVTPKH